MSGPEYEAKQCVQPDRFIAYSAINNRLSYDVCPDNVLWRTNKKLAVYVAINVESFNFEGLGASICPRLPPPDVDVLNWSWREYGNRVGVWRMIELLDQLHLPCAALLNSDILDHCPEVADAFVQRGDEMVAHGHTNSERQSSSDFVDPKRERQLIKACTDKFFQRYGCRPLGWLSPWIAETRATSDLLHQEGYRYTLNWAMDDQLVPLVTRELDGTSECLWSVPYTQELNDIPTIVNRHIEAPTFAQMIIDQFDEMLEQAQRTPGLVMSIALHPYIMGQPHRLRHLRRALQHIKNVSDRTGDVWITTPKRLVDDWERRK